MKKLTLHADNDLLESWGGANNTWVVISFACIDWENDEDDTEPEWLQPWSWLPATGSKDLPFAVFKRIGKNLKRVQFDEDPKADFQPYEDSIAKHDHDHLKKLYELQLEKRIASGTKFQTGEGQDIEARSQNTEDIRALSSRWASTLPPQNHLLGMSWAIELTHDQLTRMGEENDDGESATEFLFVPIFTDRPIWPVSPPQNNADITPVKDVDLPANTSLWQLTYQDTPDGREFLAQANTISRNDLLGADGADTTAAETDKEKVTPIGTRNALLHMKPKVAPNDAVASAEEDSNHELTDVDPITNILQRSMPVCDFASLFTEWLRLQFYLPPPPEQNTDPDTRRLGERTLKELCSFGKQGIIMLAKDFADMNLKEGVQGTCIWELFQAEVGSELTNAAPDWSTELLDQIGGEAWDNFSAACKTLEDLGILEAIPDTPSDPLDDLILNQYLGFTSAPPPDVLTARKAIPPWLDAIDSFLGALREASRSSHERSSLQTIVLSQYVDADIKKEGTLLPATDITSAFDRVWDDLGNPLQLYTDSVLEATTGPAGNRRSVISRIALELGGKESEQEVVCKHLLYGEPALFVEKMELQFGNKLLDGFLDAWKEFVTHSSGPQVRLGDDLNKERLLPAPAPHGVSISLMKSTGIQQQLDEMSRLAGYLIFCKSEFPANNGHKNKYFELNQARFHLPPAPGTPSQPDYESKAIYNVPSQAVEWGGLPLVNLRYNNQPLIADPEGVDASIEKDPENAIRYVWPKVTNPDGVPVPLPLPALVYGWKYDFCILPVLKSGAMSEPGQAHDHPFLWDIAPDELTSGWDTPRPYYRRTLPGPIVVEKPSGTRPLPGIHPLCQELQMLQSPASGQTPDRSLEGLLQEGNRNPEIAVLFDTGTFEGQNLISLPTECHYKISKPTVLFDEWFRWVAYEKSDETTHRIQAASNRTRPLLWNVQGDVSLKLAGANKLIKAEPGMSLDLGDVLDGHGTADVYYPSQAEPKEKAGDKPFVIQPLDAVSTELEPWKAPDPALENAFYARAQQVFPPQANPLMEQGVFPFRVPGDTGPVDGPGGFEPAGAAHIVLKADASSEGQRLTWAEDASTLTLTTKPGEVWQLTLFSLARKDHFAPDTKRWSDVVLGEEGDKRRGIYSEDGIEEGAEVTYYLFGPVSFHLEGADTLYKKFADAYVYKKFTDANLRTDLQFLPGDHGKMVLQLTEPIPEEKIPRYAFVSRAITRHQIWRWHGKHIRSFNSGEPENLHIWDRSGFHHRPDEDQDYVQRELRISLTGANLADDKAQSTIMLEQDHAEDPRCLYYRAAVELRSRYETVLKTEFARVVSHDPSPVARNWNWVRGVLKARPLTRMPKPSVRFVLPLINYEPERGTPERAALIVFHDQWFAQAGLAEELDWEIEQLADNTVESADSRFYFNAGFDPTLYPDALKPVSQVGKEVQQAISIKGPFGHSFESGSPSPKFVNTSFIMTLGNLEGYPQPEHFLCRIRFRRKLNSNLVIGAQRPSDENGGSNGNVAGAVSQFDSEWGSWEWVSFTSNALEANLCWKMDRCSPIGLKIKIKDKSYRTESTFTVPNSTPGESADQLLYLLIVTRIDRDVNGQPVEIYQGTFSLSADSNQIVPHQEEVYAATPEYRGRLVELRGRPGIHLRPEDDPWELVYGSKNEMKPESATETGWADPEYGRTEFIPVREDAKLFPTRVSKPIVINFTNEE